MNVSVIIPFQSDDPTRKENYRRVRNSYAHHFPTWELWTWYNSPPFARGIAINEAAEHCAGGILVFNDADTLVEPEQLHEAVVLAASAPGLVQAFDSFVWLERDGKENQGWPSRSQCVAAISAECFRETGGYDPRFVGWGYEDLAFDLVCGSMWPLRAVPGRVLHHWHPRTEGKDLEQEYENVNLYHRYAQANGDVAGLLAIRAEA